MTDRIAPERGVEAPVDCDRFDTLLPDYLESTLAPAARGWAEGHLAECARCRTLTDELVAITRQAQALGPLQPERDLWAGIAARIEAPVVPLSRTGEQAVPPLRVERTTAPRPADRFVPTRRWLAAAAGVLVAVSVGSTYLVMRASGRVEPATVAATTPAPVTRPAAPAAPATPVPDSTPVAPTPTQVAATTDTAPPGAEARLRVERRAASEARRFASSTDGGDAYAPVMQTYDKEIAALRAALKQRADLDSGTVAVLEKNLRLIDDAIAQSRDALRRDPHSRVVGDELTRALGLKVELLRTAVLLPSRS